MHLLVMSKSSQMSAFHSWGTVPPAKSIQMGERKQNIKRRVCYVDFHEQLKLAPMWEEFVAGEAP